MQLELAQKQEQVKQLERAVAASHASEATATERLATMELRSEHDAQQLASLQEEAAGMQGEPGREVAYVED